MRVQKYTLSEQLCWVNTLTPSITVAEHSKIYLLYPYYYYVHKLDTRRKLLPQAIKNSSHALKSLTEPKMLTHIHLLHRGKTYFNERTCQQNLLTTCIRAQPRHLSTDANDCSGNQQKMSSNDKFCRK